jgi:choline-sulfatase
LKKRFWVLLIVFIAPVALVIFAKSNLIRKVTSDGSRIIGEAAFNEDCKSSGVNVILVIIDALRPDHLGCYGYFRNTSPNIDALSKKSLVFKNAYSAAPWTRSAIASIISSKLPIEHMIYSEHKNERLGDEFLTIQEFFNEKKYITAAIYANPHLDLGLVQNFSYIDYKGVQLADLIYSKAINWLKNNSDKKFFLLIHSIDPHDPYHFHEAYNFTCKDSKYRRLQPFFPPRRDGSGITCENRENIIHLNKEQLSEMEANYDGEIAFTDHHFGRLISYLKQSKLYEKTIIIITADHGEEFLDHGGYWHGCTLYNELIKVPLIIYLPGVNQKLFEQKVSTIDIFPTLVDLFDRDSYDAYNLTGQSLLPLVENNKKWREKPILSATGFRGLLKYSLIVGDYKIIRYADGDVIGLYNLKNDPNESENLMKSDSKTLKFLNGLLLLKLITGDKETKYHTEIGSELDEETLEDLKSLGYIR